jgi:microcystin-dependent protein
MVSPPFSLNTSAPGDTDIASVFPALDRGDKATIVSWLETQWNNYGHTLADYYDGVGSANGLVSDPSQPASGTAAVFRNSVGVMAIIDGETGTIQALGVPTGTILDFAGATPPNGYLLCYGQQVSQSTYANLYAVLGNTWGVATGGNFFVPDLRGRATFGLDNMGGTAAGRISNTFSGTTLGASGGVEQATLTQAQLPNCSFTVTDPGHHHASITSGTAYVVPQSGVYGPNAVGGGQSSGTVTSLNSASTGTATTGISVTSGGSGSATNTIAPGAIVQKIIKY